MKEHLAWITPVALLMTVAGSFAVGQVTTDNNTAAIDKVMKATEENEDAIRTNQDAIREAQSASALKLQAIGHEQATIKGQLSKVIQLLEGN